MKKLLIITLITVLLSGIIYCTYVIVKRATYTPSSTDSNSNEPEENPVDVVEPTVENTQYTYPNTPVLNENFFEKLKTIAGQQSYIAYPKTIDTSNPPTIIIFSHGSNTTIVANMNDAFMKEMRAYGKYFTKRNYAFVASNMHYVNANNYSWASSTNSVTDMKSLIDWVAGHYQTQIKINLLAHSLGGIPTFNFAFIYPTTIGKIALLAPSSNDYTKAQFKLIKNVPIYIWHGDKDVNVPLSSSTVLRNMYNSYGYDNLTLEILENKTHWDVDYELKPEILEFFTK